MPDRCRFSILEPVPPVFGDSSNIYHFSNRLSSYKIMESVKADLSAGTTTSYPGTSFITSGTPIVVGKGKIFSITDSATFKLHAMNVGSGGARTIDSALMGGASLFNKGVTLIDVDADTFIVAAISTAYNLLVQKYDKTTELPISSVVTLAGMENYNISFAFKGLDGTIYIQQDEWFWGPTGFTTDLVLKDDWPNLGMFSAPFLPNFPLGVPFHIAGNNLYVYQRNAAASNSIDVAVYDLTTKGRLSENTYAMNTIWSTVSGMSASVIARGFVSDGANLYVTVYNQTTSCHTIFSVDPVTLVPTGFSRAGNGTYDDCHSPALPYV